MSKLKYLPCFLILVVMIYNSREMALGALEGIRLSAAKIIPTLFPFFILADLWSYISSYDSGEGLVAKVFSRVFRLPPITLPAFILGTVCGFPLGVKYANDKYKNNALSIDQLKSASVISSNPSAAFVISGVGMGIYGDIYIGIYLYLIVISSAMITGLIFRPKELTQNTAENIGQSFELTSSIKNALVTSCYVSSFIIFFSSVIGLIRGFTKNGYILALISSLLELSNGVSYVSKISAEASALKFSLTAFALSFSGLSVYLQSISILPKEFPKGEYFAAKLIQGGIALLIAFVFNFYNVKQC